MGHETPHNRGNAADAHTMLERRQEAMERAAKQQHEKPHPMAHLANLRGMQDAMCGLKNHNVTCESNNFVTRVNRGTLAEVSEQRSNSHLDALKTRTPTSLLGARG